MYYENHRLYEFESKILDIFPNVEDKNRLNIVIVAESAFYPTSGGQLHDIGTMTIDGVTYDVVDVTKVGKSILHYLNNDLPGDKTQYIGKDISATLDAERRGLLRAHHTGTHIVYAACRDVLGPHIW